MDGAGSFSFLLPRRSSFRVCMCHRASTKERSEGREGATSSRRHKGKPHRRCGGVMRRSAPLDGRVGSANGTVKLAPSRWWCCCFPSSSSCMHRRPSLTHRASALPYPSSTPPLPPVHHFLRDGVRVLCNRPHVSRLQSGRTNACSHRELVLCGHAMVASSTSTELLGRP